MVSLSTLAIPQMSHLDFAFVGNFCLQVDVPLALGLFGHVILLGRNGVNGLFCFFLKDNFLRSFWIPWETILGTGSKESKGPPPNFHVGASAKWSLAPVFPIIIQALSFDCSMWPPQWRTRSGRACTGAYTHISIKEKSWLLDFLVLAKKFLLRTFFFFFGFLASAGRNGGSRFVGREWLRNLNTSLGFNEHKRGGSNPFFGVLGFFVCKKNLHCLFFSFGFFFFALDLAM